MVREDAKAMRLCPGDNNWPVIKSCVDEIILVSDDEIVAAMRHIWERMKLVRDSEAFSCLGDLMN